MNHSKNIEFIVESRYEILLRDQPNHTLYRGVCYSESKLKRRLTTLTQTVYYNARYVITKVSYIEIQLYFTVKTKNTVGNFKDSKGNLKEYSVMCYINLLVQYQQMVCSYLSKR